VGITTMDLTDSKPIIEGEMDYRKGLQYWNRCQYRSALPFLLKAASFDFPASFLKLYSMYVCVYV